MTVRLVIKKHEFDKYFVEKMDLFIETIYESDFYRTHFSNFEPSLHGPLFLICLPLKELMLRCRYIISHANILIIVHVHAEIDDLSTLNGPLNEWDFST